MEKKMFLLMENLIDSVKAAHTSRGMVSEIEKLLLQGVNPRAHNRYGETLGEVLENFLQVNEFAHSIINGACSTCQLYSLARLIKRYSPGIGDSARARDFHRVKFLLTSWLKPSPDDQFHIVKSSCDIQQLEFIHAILSNDFEKVKNNDQVPKDWINSTHPATGNSPLSLAVLENRNLEMTRWLLDRGADPDVRLAVPICHDDLEPAYSPLAVRLIYRIFSCRMEHVSSYVELLRLLCEYGPRLGARCAVSAKHLSAWLVAFLMPEENFELKSTVLNILLKASSGLCIADRDSEGRSCIQMHQCYEFIPRSSMASKLVARFLTEQFRWMALPRSKRSSTWTSDRKAKRKEAQKILMGLVLRHMGSLVGRFVQEEIEQMEECEEHEALQRIVGNYIGQSIDLENEAGPGGLLKTDFAGDTFLKHAVLAGEREVAKSLVDHDPELTLLPDAEDRIPLHHVKLAGEAELAHTLLAYKEAEQRVCRDIVSYTSVPPLETSILLQKNLTPLQCKTKQTVEI